MTFAEAEIDFSDTPLVRRRSVDGPELSIHLDVEALHFLQNNPNLVLVSGDDDLSPLTLPTEPS